MENYIGIFTPSDANDMSGGSETSAAIISVNNADAIVVTCYPIAVGNIVVEAVVYFYVQIRYTVVPFRKELVNV